MFAGMNMWQIKNYNPIEYYIDSEKLWENRSGVYYHDEFYCVKIRNYGEYQVLSTLMHEHCHYLIYNDYEHFCKGKDDEVEVIDETTTN